MTYKIGIVKTDITPPVGVFLAGFAERNEPSTGVYHPLRAVATVIDDGTTPLLILAAEWLGFYDQTERMRGRLTEAMGIPAANIVLSGTHTHCGPAVRQMDLFRHGALDEDYITRAIDNMTAAATEAWSSRTDAQLHFGNGHCTVSRCRRKPDPDNPPFMFRNMMPLEDKPGLIHVLRGEAVENEQRVGSRLQQVSPGRNVRTGDPDIEQRSLREVRGTRFLLLVLAAAGAYLHLSQVPVDNL